MLAILFLLTSTFTTEIAQSLSKRLLRQRRESIYDSIFLGMFWGLAFMVITLAFGAEFRVSAQALPTMIARIILELVLVYITAESIVRADRSTVGFLRLITIPLLLVVDIALGYHITNLQLLGVGVMFCALVLAFRHNKSSQRGAWLVVLSSILAVGTISLYKYNITHYNSVAGEQVVSLGIVVVFFYILSARQHHRSPMRMLFHPVTGTQALVNGIAVPLESFALSVAPASLIIAYKRSFALMWSIVFGNTKFHEHSLPRKLSSAGLMVVSIILITGLYRG